MYISIPVFWAEDEWERKEDLGLDIETNLGELTINTNHIVAHHSTDDGCTMIRLTNAECFKSPIAHEDFKHTIGDIDIAIELKIADN
jgi:hypothetical protein